MGNLNIIHLFLLANYYYLQNLGWIFVFKTLTYKCLFIFYLFYFTPNNYNHSYRFFIEKL